jgi:hypothetical protein
LFILATMVFAMFLVRISAQTVATNPVRFTWNANSEPDIAGYKFEEGSTVTDVGNVTVFTNNYPVGDHTVDVRAYNTSGQISPPSTPLTFTIAGQAPSDPCATLPGGPVTIVVTSYTTPLPGGQEGTVTAKALGPAPVIQLQVMLGTQVIGAIDGTELRFVRAIGFATPRVVGTYNLFVTATDNRGCHAKTTAARPLVIQ